MHIENHANATTWEIGQIAVCYAKWLFLAIGENVNKVYALFPEWVIEWGWVVLCRLCKLC
jgi:hypothetical protein